MTIHFTEDELKRIMETKPVGDFYPYDTEEYDYDAVDDYIAKVVGSLASIHSINYEADFRNYGSGYASYVNVFCWKKDGSSSTERDGVLWIDGVWLYICRLAPVVVMGKGQVTKHANGGSYDYLHSETVDVFPAGDWQEQVQAIRNVLEQYHIKPLDRHFMSQPLPFATKIPTVLAKRRSYKLFDAFFYWAD